MKKVIVHKSAVPIYIAAGAWAAYALLFPLYRVGHFAIAAAVSAAAYFVSRCFCKDCLLYTSPSPRDYHSSRMPSSA